MTILLLSSVGGNGGSPSTLFHNARILSKRGWTPVFFAPGEYWKERGDKEGVEVDRSLELRRGFRPISFLRDFFKLRKIIRERSASAVVVQKSPEQWLAAIVIWSMRKRPALIRLRGVVFEIKPSFFNRILHNSMDAVICSASVIKSQYEKLRGFKMDRVSVLLEGIDAEKFKPATPVERLAARKILKLDASALVIGTAGRPAPVKGHDILVRAFAKAFGADRHPHVRLAIFADESRRSPGSYKNLDALCRELGIRERADLAAGHLSDMRVVYQALDAYILPSLGSEGSSRAGLEAIASGLPLIASNVGVLPDLIENERSGLLLPPGDVDALAAALKALVDSWPCWKKFGDAARERAVNQLSEKKYGEDLCTIIESTQRQKS